jgi:PTH1 family peptidyl-tRNA hydrolase
MSEISIAIVGLGNPGNKYCKNRHNVGFLLLDYLEKQWNAASINKKSGAEFAKLTHSVNQKEFNLILIRPLKFMNLSGEPVCDLMNYFKIQPDHLIVLHDEIELPFGEIRSKKGGGHKGHNGLRDIILHCNSSDFYRIRFGVGRPERGDVASYVLSDFRSEEQDRLNELFEKAENEILNLIEKIE